MLRLNWITTTWVLETYIGVQATKTMLNLHCKKKNENIPDIFSSFVHSFETLTAAFLELKNYCEYHLALRHMRKLWWPEGIFSILFHSLFPLYSVFSSSPSRFFVFRIHVRFAGILLEKSLPKLVPLAFINKRNCTNIEIAKVCMSRIIKILIQFWQFLLFFILLSCTSAEIFCFLHSWFSENHLQLHFLNNKNNHSLW